MMDSLSTFPRPLCRVVAFVVAAACGAGAASAQSLGEWPARKKPAARPSSLREGLHEREPAERARPPPTAAAAAAAPSASGGRRPPTPSGVQPSERGKAGQPGSRTRPAPPGRRPEAGRGRLAPAHQTERDALARAQTFAEALQSRINALVDRLREPRRSGTARRHRRRSAEGARRARSREEGDPAAHQGDLRHPGRSAPRGRPPGWVR